MYQISLQCMHWNRRIPCACDASPDWTSRP